MKVAELRERLRLLPATSELCFETVDPDNIDYHVITLSEATGNVYAQGHKVYITLTETDREP